MTLRIAAPVCLACAITATAGEGRSRFKIAAHPPASVKSLEALKRRFEGGAVTELAPAAGRYAGVSFDAGSGLHVPYGFLYRRTQNGWKLDRKYRPYSVLEKGRLVRAAIGYSFAVASDGSIVVVAAERTPDGHRDRNIDRIPPPAPR